ncbi:hypothetical protein BG262_06080 [Floricoccus penangensis]|uniref:NAD-dependent epimerase/dehydratase domain-containing protein n=1 Tax=Floricoccus penangensis TaxID=1859475 RepID=A0A9Q5JEW9_9LACT|nr:NAD(P)-dependent oxidoreductase [Floricoccus penangensis]OFI46050.1 hypothetical protein BG262_06080 [Floricoccus penangensis]
MKIFITGGTGFLGKYVIERLLKDNHELYVLARKPEKITQQTDNVHVIKGALEDMHTWTDNLKGMDVVIHMAAPVVFWGEWKMYEDSIVNASVDLLREAEKNNVKRFIYISSESVLQDKKPLINVDETTPYPKKPNSYYGLSKMMSEKKVLEPDYKIERIILRPTFLWGKGMPQISMLVDKVNKGQFMWIDKGNHPIEMVHAKNVAEAIALACNKGKDKDIFYVTDDEPKLAKKFFYDLLLTQGVTIPDKSMPGVILRPIASFVEFIWRTFKIKSYPPLDRFDLSFLAMPRSYRIDKIKKVLGYKPIISFEDGLKEMKEKS